MTDDAIVGTFLITAILLMLAGAYGKGWRDCADDLKRRQGDHDE